MRERASPYRPFGARGKRPGRGSLTAKFSAVKAQFDLVGAQHGGVPGPAVVGASNRSPAPGGAGWDRRRTGRCRRPSGSPAIPRAAPLAARYDDFGKPLGAARFGDGVAHPAVETVRRRHPAGAAGAATARRCSRRARSATGRPGRPRSDGRRNGTAPGPWCGAARAASSAGGVTGIRRLSSQSRTSAFAPYAWMRRQRASRSYCSSSADICQSTKSASPGGPAESGRAPTRPSLILLVCGIPA